MIGARGKGLSITAGIAAALLPGAIWAQMTTGGAGEVSGAGGAPLSTLSAQQPALAPLATPLSDRMVLGDRTPEQPPLQSVAPDTTGDSLGQPFTPSSATADAATVLADRMILQADNTLIASGGVVVWYQDARLVASRIIVNGDSGDLTIEGPIHLSRPGVTDPGRDAIVIADSAQLDRKLQDGIIRGARLIIARELQLAARQATRSGEGRFTRLDRVVASACLVSPQNPTPLWEIRARSITHDAQTRLITFENPQLRAFGIPIAATPFTITAPDPTVDRKSGFLRPEIRTTSNLGFGVKIPYFQTLGDQADLTITPYVSANRTRTLELRYRQAFARGVTEWNGAISRDDIMPGKTRGYVFGNAAFDLPRGYRLGIQVQAASDRGYLLDYGITDADRLWSGISLERITREKLFFGRVGNYESLRDDENNATSPAQVADVIWQRRFVPDLIGGQGLMEWSAHAHRRPSDADQVGRDVARGSVGLDWRRQEILPGGLVGAAIAGLDADLYRIAQDSRYDDVETRVDPRIGVELRWPLIGGSGGATHLVEPVAQLLWSPPGSDKEIPNEDSRLIEFDEGNLFSDNRFPGYDARETGLRANLGLSWTRIDPTGWSLGLTAGRVLRNRPDRAFAPDSPLAGRRSDWLLAANYDSGNGLAIANRALFDDDFNISRNELRLGLLRPDLQVSAGHLWIDSDAAEGRDSDISELTGNVGWQVRRGWWANAETRYDFVADRAQSASLDLAYRNECLTMEMGVSRRFTASDSVRPETSFDLSVRLGGFGRSDDASGTVARRTCMR
ncbi:MAG: LPS-assembly protein LptD [Paracoccus sp. (in: a-proteobacteria)]|uniref:LPS-assembly protein LptD n=1 Tax=unclassified Paracoccus (in: a-proteobacteria) TaxID=2688777 RepID=UPI000C58799A|nr:MULTISPECIES: LPS assembly protein LptD [unclassified Paracoccus (in: a-proteobacteria)]MAN56506.1 organic solvent tolerance protein [Paracoccus sp. (in: a-proteobacteria)]MBA50360.1 organic solvent tolerance protein [Paracoccus sp. (in: a-proteobacteria)]|tara:strand:+ start:1265 stop:3646 length:2382 start_codon:yes stop_codon:yes gene_type:complete